ncbi:hypothetical protein BOX15_Mlig010555g2 [Macrostomum lignano]|uniref:ABC transporter domain-containing protein n=1 Tax=Macrostomum lignano TaxID=282301 RepID=A0A267DWF4_9PLAT|nr:hypothetical protein BOX15_Mlig010555g2 [Macrostomum lignano]
MGTVSQSLFLLRTQLALKSWNLVLFLPLLLLTLFSIQWNHLLISGWLHARGKGRLTGITGYKISQAQPSIIYTDQLSSTTLSFTLSMLKSMDSNLKENQAHWKCANWDSCVSNLYSNMMHNNEKRQKFFIDYDRKALVCPATYASELYCSFFGSIFFYSSATEDATDWFQNYSMFHLTSDASDISEESTSKNFCQADRNYFFYLPKLLCFLSILVMTIFCFYFLLTTISCIVKLKSCGFLQLMIRKGLSPASYWASVWLWTSAEVLLLSICMTLSFYIQCPGFYSPERVYLIAVQTGSFLYCAASFMLLLTVLTNNYYAICKGTITYVIAVGVLIISNRLAQESLEFVGLKQLQMGLLLLPCGNFAEQLQANLVGQVNPKIENKFHATGVLINVLFSAVNILLTLFLDYVLTTGNALRYSPILRVCTAAPGFDLPDMFKQQPGIEFLENNDIIVRYAKVSCKPLTNDADHNEAQTGQFSVDLYDSQITAVIADDASKVNEFLGVMTGAQPVTSGSLWIDGRIAANSRNRPLSQTRVSVCPAEDALCNNLTVLHTLQMALVSRGMSWIKCERDIHPTLALLRLVDILPRRVSSLSAGQARNLSIACALLGNPKLVVLFEPTRHLDPASRQRLWRLLEEHRIQQRCIVVGVAAHSPDEINEMERRANRLILLSSPSGQNIASAGSSQYMRLAANFELIVQARLRDPSRGESALEKLRSQLSSVLNGQIQLTLEKELLSAHFDSRLTGSDDNLTMKVIKAFKSIEQDVEKISLKRLTLTELYNRLRRVNTGKIDSLFLNGRQNRSSSGIHSKNIEADDLFKNSGDHFDSELSQRRSIPKNSETTFFGAVRGICRFSCLLHRRSCCRIFCQCIFVPIFLLGFFAAPLLIEKAWLTKLKVSRNISNLPVKKFTRGVCIYDNDVPSKYKIDQYRCGMLLTGSVIAGNNYIVIPKQWNTQLYSYLQTPAVLKQIHKHCTAVKQNELPCPVAYANSWSRTSLNYDRQLVIGSYGVNSHPDFSTASAFIASLSAMKYFMPAVKTTANFHILIVNDYRSVALPLLGQTSQLFIVCVLPAYYINDLLQQRSVKWPSFLVSVGVSPARYFIGQLLMLWLQYAPVYCLAIIVRMVINPVVYGSKYQWLVCFLTVTFGLMNNLLLVYLLSLIIPSVLRRLLPTAYLIVSILISSFSIILPSVFPLSLSMIVALPPFATGMLSYYSTKVYRYSLEFFNFINDGADSSRFRLAAYTERHILACLIVIPLHFATLTAVILLMPLIKKNLCYKSTGANAKNNVSIMQNATGGYHNTMNADYSRNFNSQQGNSVVEVQQLTKYFSPSICAVHDVNLDVKSGKVLTFVGSTGSGLSTVVSAIAGRLTPSSGECRVRSGASGRWVSGPAVKFKQAVAYSPHRSPLFKLATVVEHALFYSNLLGVSFERLAQLLEDFRLVQCKNKLVSQLSVGQKRRLGLVIALMKNETILFIADDVSTGVTSPKDMNIMRSILQNGTENMTLITTSHDLNVAAQAPSLVGLINQGGLMCVDTMSDIRESLSLYILEIELSAKGISTHEDTKVDILRRILARFYETNVLDQTVSWMKIALPEQSVEPAIESINWLLQLKSNLATVISDLLFYPASDDQLLEYVFETHEKQFRKQPERGLEASPLVELPEFYDV